VKLFPADNTFRTDNQSPIETLQQSLEAPHSGDYPNTAKIDMDLAIRPHETSISDSAGLVTEREFARTYDGGDYDDAWEAVEQYRRAITYHADNPDVGIGELVRISGATRVSVQSWIDDGGTPAAVQGLYTAHKHRWIGVTYDEITPLNVLAAYVYSSGTISSHNYHPSFTLADGDSMVTNTLELMDIGYRDIERPGRTEIRPLARPKTRPYLGASYRCSACRLVGRRRSMTSRYRGISRMHLRASANDSSISIVKIVHNQSPTTRG